MRRLMRLIRGCLTLVIFVVIMAVCVVAVAAGLHVGDEPDNIAVTAILTPDSVAVGETFTLTISVENLDLESVELAGIGLDTGLLDGAEVQVSEPPYRGIKNRSYPLYGDWQEFGLNRTLVEGDTIDIVVTLVGTEPGIYSGDLTLWIKGEVLGLFPLDRAWREGIEFEVR